jgi:rRNA-processing protein FCF1
MKQIILDTNFILTCVKQKIDFFEEISLMGIQIIIPKQVIAEIQRLKTPNAQLALKLLEKNKFKKIDIGAGHVDKKIIQYLKDKPRIILATLDRELKSKVRNSKMVIRERKRLELV